jgi:hypothetical protein
MNIKKIPAIDEIQTTDDNFDFNTTFIVNNANDFAFGLKNNRNLSMAVINFTATFTQNCL